jgi:hypothetical protein
VIPVTRPEVVSIHGVFERHADVAWCLSL